MATSLSEQLSQLRTPQTDLLLQDKTRPSLLFDPKEAASLDRATLLSIGRNGLEKLVELCPFFNKFDNSLFAKNSVNLERAIEDATLNESLNREIEIFLRLLSSYFLLHASHKALEWLIYRYHIHEYNRDQFVLLILPYHESRIFARAVQLLDLSNKGDKWYWMKSLQKRGLPQVSQTIVNHLSTDDEFLKMLCNHVISTVKVHTNQTSQPTTLCAFYTTLVLGLIEQATTITETQINYLLPTLFYGLKSSVLDLTAASYMIIAHLMTKVKLDDCTIEKILLKTFKKTNLKQEATTLLLYLYQSPINRLTVIPQSLVLQLSSLLWFIETVSQIHSKSMNASRFAVPFLQAACQVIAEDPDTTISVQNMMDTFLTHVRLNDDAVDAILSNVLTCKFFRSEMPKNAKDFIARFYQNFERSYPERFDKYLKHLTEQDENDIDSKQALNFFISWPFITNEMQESVKILDKLSHASSAQRLCALEILGDNNITIPKSFRGMMRKTLQVRFYDPDVNVVKALLSIPTNKLISLLPTETLMDNLMTLLSTCHTASKKELAKLALKILLELCEDGYDTKIFITALPYLFPATKEDVAVAMEVLYSNFAKNNIYMQYMMKDLEKSPLNADTISSTAFHNILNYELLPDTNSILNSMRQQISHGDAASLFFNMILLGSVCRVPVGSMPANVAREVIEMATEMIKKYPRIQLLHNCNIITGDNIQAALKLTSEGILPLQVGTYVLEMVHRRLNLKSEPKLDFVDNAEQSNLTVRLLEMFFEGMDNEKWRKHYFRCLQIFFQRHFAMMKDLISFLSQLYIRPVRVQTSYHCLQITLELLDNSSIQWVFQDQHFVTNLLLVLARPNNVCRSMAVNILKKLTQNLAHFNLAIEPFCALLQEIAVRSDEIVQDSEQLSLMFYYILSPDLDVSCLMKQRKKLQQAQKLLFDVVLQEEIPIDRRSELLDVLTHVNDTEILRRLAPLGLRLLQKLENESTRSQPAGKALRNILQRFNHVTIEALNDSQVWLFFETSILRHDLYVLTESQEQISPSIILLKQINDMFFMCAGKISRDLQSKIFSKMLDVLTDCEVSKVISNATRAMHRIRIDASFIMSELQTMKQNRPEQQPEDTPKKKSKRYSQMYLLASPKIVYTKAWKRGETLLQIVQHAKNIEHEETLYGVLFDLVNVCVSLEELSPVEYTNQLILQTIYRMMMQDLPLRNASLYISLITKCIRTSRNPQTHHHALLVLVELLKKVDVNRAFLNIMPIFTFMGSTVVRQDDSYSIQITSKVLETVVPIINADDKENNACMMLRIFVTSLPDIPEHRRIALFVKLLQLLDKYLHFYYLITFENHAKLSTKPVNETSAQHLEFALQMCQEFPLLRLLQICMNVIDFVKILPIDIEEEQDKQTAMNFPYNHVYDVSKSTPKILRHYKLTAVQFFSSLLSSQDFVNRISQLSTHETIEMNEYCDNLASQLIMLIQMISKVADQDQSKPSAKYWKVLLHHLYEALDLVNNLLPNTMFLKNVRCLQTTDVQLSVRKKILDLLNVRLAQRKFGNEDHVDLLGLIEHLICFVNAEEKIESQEYELVQQTTLVSLKLLAKLLATDHPNVFKPILEMTTELLRSKDGPVLANAALCVAELVCLMRTHALTLLNKFMPPILKLLKTHCCQNVPDITVVSIVSALQKIVDSLGNFLSSYLSKLLFELTRLNSLYTGVDHPKTGIIISRLKMITQKISNYTPLRILLPVVSTTYDTLLRKNLYHRIPSLMNILADCFDSVPSAKLNVTSCLSEFFLKVLQFRESINSYENDDMSIDVEDVSKHIVAIEESTSKAFVALVLKLSEVTFNPLYQDIFKWAEKNTKHMERNITFYKLSANIAENLKSLFSLFAGLFLKHAALLLKTNNTYVSNTKHELTLLEESSRIELVEAILLTLHRVFNYDAHNFVSQERFEILAQPIVEQIENTMGTEEEYESRASRLIVPCIASFVSAIPDDALHKQLVCQILLKTKHTKPYVRRTALNGLVEIARKLGEDFLSFLPETMPFLAEILEDEDITTEKCAQKAVCALEEILGEPLQKYF
ncbi:HEAT repeat-containing protein 1 [Harpegnathos saltator]|uniref:HEAT repeat-containing protein 1 n=1 Tax=Harpegnathos saltator TaxID=610380 RepID=E2B8C7_HARSA|nr:HEAT repeat-containing protein 1 [Harpegnathos saltator]EFN88053.1 HEAT repeat-containing protein 1 [Harpegnathos saltator]